MAFSVPDLPVRLRRAGAAHRREDDARSITTSTTRPTSTTRTPRSPAPRSRTRRSRRSSQNLSQVPDDKRPPCATTRGGHAEPHLFWESMGPNGGGAPSGELGDAIDSAFGSFDDFKAQFKDAGIKRFGSGWTWLVWDGSGLQLYVDRQPGQPAIGRPDAAARHRRLGARVLPELPEPPARLPRRLVEHGQLEQGRRAVRRTRLDVKSGPPPAAAPRRRQAADADMPWRCGKSVLTVSTA